MKVNIQFELTDSEAAGLISELQYFVAQSGSNHLNKLLNEIIKDSNISLEIASHFIRWVKSYTSFPVTTTSTFKYDLKFADWWLAADDGLAQLCNLTLMDIKKVYGGTFTEVLGEEVYDKDTVQEVIEVTIGKYSG